jgi:DnaJ-domain-containing protein 1
MARRSLRSADVAPTSDLHDAVARVIVPVIIADGRATPDELEVVRRLDHAGLGPLSFRVQRILAAVTGEPLDLQRACRTIRAGGRSVVGAVLSMLARVAGADGTATPPGFDRFLAIAEQLGVGVAEARRYLEPVRRGPVAMQPDRHRAPEAVVAALLQLGLSLDATRADVEAAYLQLVKRYDPGRLAPMGADFVSLAVRELAALTESYERARAAVRA